MRLCHEPEGGGIIPPQERVDDNGGGGVARVRLFSPCCADYGVEGCGLAYLVGSDQDGERQACCAVFAKPEQRGVAGMKVLDLFSGIGGFSLGLERTGGFETVAFCEIEKFPRKVLKKHWPEVPIYEDVTTLTGDILERDGISVDVITGGFPCQDISIAGKQAGISEGTRSGLWSEIVRLIGELRPRYVIVENVANLLAGPSEKRGGWFGRILGDLAECGYDAEWRNIPASMVHAPHRRERVWIVAYPKDLFSDGGKGDAGKLLASGPLSKLRNDGRAVFMADADSKRLQGAEREEGSGEEREPIGHSTKRGSKSRGEWQAEPSVGRVANGVPRSMDRLKCCGNAVVPQIPELIGRAILAREASK